MVYLLRNYVEMSYLFMKNQCDIDYFYYRFELSKYEYKNDLIALKDMAESYGVKIEADEYKIKLFIIDRDKHEKYYKQFFSFYYANRYNFNNNELILYLITANELLSNEYLNVDEFAFRVGCSKSNLRSPINTARVMLNKYDIETLHRPHYGLYTKGDEFNKRRCIANINYKLMPGLFDLGEEWNNLRQVDYDYVYQKFSKLCRLRNITLTAEHYKNICYYISITEKRYRKYSIKSIDVESNILSKIEFNPQLKSFCNEICNAFDMKLDDVEKKALMVILFIYNADRNSLLNYADELYHEEIAELFKIITSNLEKEYHLTIRSNLYISAILEELSFLIIKHHTGELKIIKEKILSANATIYSYPLCYYINVMMAKVIGNYYGESVSLSVTENLTDIIYYYIEGLEYNFSKANILVTSRFSRYSAKLIKDKLYKDLDDNYVANIDTCECVDLLNNTKFYDDNYDLIIADVNIRNSNKSIKFSDVNSSMVKLDSYLRLHRNLCRELSTENDIKVLVKDIDVNNIEVLDMKHINVNIEFLYVLKKSLVIVNSSDDECIIKVGNFSKSIMINGNKANNYIILKCNINERNIRIVNTLLHEIVFDTMFAEAIRCNPGIEILNEQINMVMK